ncbi:MAG: 5-(carboxyamino)imidazole ribonucleotide mutase [Solirubrobacterales bacterium]
MESTSESAVISPELATELSEIEISDSPAVGVVMGSETDRGAMQGAVDELKERGIRHEVTVISAHRDPELVRTYATGARARGLKVIIAGAGMAAALPGMVAAFTDLPVIGVPIRAEDAVSGGLDALLAIAQAPPGVPVACVAVNGSQNAAILAARILFS